MLQNSAGAKRWPASEAAIESVMRGFRVPLDIAHEAARRSGPDDWLPACMRLGGRDTGSASTELAYV